MKSRVSEFHNPAFNSLIGEVRQYAEDELGLQFIPDERVTVIGQEVAEQWRVAYPNLGGGFNADTCSILALERRLPNRPRTTAVLLGSFLMHEGTHSSAYNPDEHYFFNEAVAGFAEHDYLVALRRHKKLQTAQDFTLQHAPGVQIVIPGDFRYADGEEFADEPIIGPKGVHTSQALTAALGMSVALAAAGLTGRDILRQSKLNGTQHFTAMKDALQTFQPGMVEAIQAMPPGVSGVVQAAARLQNSSH